MRIRRRNWILKRIVLGLAVVALVVPGAAKARVDESGNVQAKAYVPFQTDFPKYDSWNVETGVQQGARPIGQRDFPELAPEVTIGARSVEQRDFPELVRQPQLGTYGLPHAGLNDYLRTHPGAVDNSKRDVSGTRVVSSGGFDWSDAGIGAALALGLVLIGGAALVAIRQLGRPQTA
jgi:hypothetical protein